MRTYSCTFAVLQGLCRNVKVVREGVWCGEGDGGCGVKVGEGGCGKEG